MEEIWKDIEGYEGLYQVSNRQRVKRLSTVIKWRGRSIVLKEKLLTIGRFKDSGRPRLSLRKERKSYSYHFSIIVAKAFPEICGEWFEGCEVHHKDRNYNNNVPENLIVLSKEEHIKEHHNDSSERTSGKSNPMYGKHHSVITRDLLSKQHEKHIIQYSLSGDYINEYNSVTKAAIALGKGKKGRTSIGKNANGKSKSAYGFIWKFA